VAERRLHGRLRHGAEDVHEAQREAAILDRVGCRLGGRADLAGHPLHSADAQNSHLRRCDDGYKGVHTPAAERADGETSAQHMLPGQGASA
jgi:hypothetical protein